MPRFPTMTPSLRGIKGSVFSALAGRLAQHDGPVFPLHIGDTWRTPAHGCQLADQATSAESGLHRYVSPKGHPRLLDAAQSYVSERTGVRIGRQNLIATPGATGGLCGAIGAILGEGDEVVIVAPHWPLVAGIVRSFHGTPVQVPIVGVAESAAQAAAILQRAITERTVAVYWNTPNNPTGRSIPRDWIQAMVEVSKAAGLWILTDEVYDQYQYRGEHTYTFSLAPERTVSTFSFSKAYGMAGNRCGFAVGPEDWVEAIQRVLTHTVYSTPSAAQVAGARALEGEAAEWVETAREEYRVLGDYAASVLGQSPPDGSTFLFVDVAHKLDSRGLFGFLEDCVDRGLFLAPGTSFGPYPNHVRVCFTCVEPSRVRAGVELLAELI